MRRNLLVIDEINSETLRYHVEDIEIGKSSGIENTRTHVLKDTLLGNLPLWTTIINMCVKNGTFPDRLKTGTITPIPKPGSPRSVLNWRPITLLSVIGKLMERVIYRELMNFLQEHDLIVDS